MRWILYIGGLSFRLLHVLNCAYFVSMYVAGRITDKYCFLHYQNEYDVLCVFQWESLRDSRGDAFIKFEPFVLHVQCANLICAQLLASTVKLHLCMFMCCILSTY